MNAFLSMLQGPQVSRDHLKHRGRLASNATGAQRLPPWQCLWPYLPSGKSPTNELHLGICTWDAFLQPLEE